MPIAFVGLAGLRRIRSLLAISGMLFAAVATLSGVVLLQMNHVSAGILIVFGIIAAVEVVVLFAVQQRRRLAS